MGAYRGFFSSPLPADRAGITVVSVGESRMEPDLVRFRRDQGWHSLQLMFTTAGSGVGDVAGVGFPAVTAGDIILMPKDQSHGYQVAPGAEHWRYLWVEFDGDCVPSLLAMLGLQGRAQVAGCGAIAAHIDQIFDLLLTRGDGALHEASAMLLHALALIERAARRPSEDPRYAAVELAKSHMARHLGQPLALAGLAAAVRLSPFHLNRMFRERTGVPPMRYLRQMRASRAKTLLHRRELKVAEIGREVGYPVLQHFSRMFKHETGMTPRRFVREIVRGPAR